jgi:hypothetical protein
MVYFLFAQLGIFTAEKDKYSYNYKEEEKSPTTYHNKYGESSIVTRWVTRLSVKNVWNNADPALLCSFKYCIVGSKEWLT